MPKRMPEGYRVFRKKPWPFRRARFSYLLYGRETLEGMNMKRMGRRDRRGVTLAELLIGLALLVGGGGTLLAGMHYATIHAEYLSEHQIAMNAAEGLLERLAATNFDTLMGSQYAAARGGIQRCLLWDLNCNGVVETGEVLNDSLLPTGALDVQLRQPSEDALRNPGNPALLDIHVAACWQSRGRSIGEDRNCNGVLDPAEDGSTSIAPTPNGWVDSPVMVSTRVGRR